MYHGNTDHIQIDVKILLSKQNRNLNRGESHLHQSHYSCARLNAATKDQEIFFDQIDIYWLVNQIYAYHDTKVAGYRCEQRSGD